MRAYTREHTRTLEQLRELALLEDGGWRDGINELDRLPRWERRVVTEDELRAAQLAVSRAITEHRQSMAMLVDHNRYSVCVWCGCERVNAQPADGCTGYCPSKEDSGA